MKKIIFGILSILLITPVFAENINGISYENSITFENLTESDNITYLQLPVTFGSAWYYKSSYLGYYGDNSFGLLRQSAISTFTGYGRDITLSNSMFIQSGDSLISGSDSLYGFGILAVQKSGVLYDFSKFQLFLSRDSSSFYSGFNPLFSFSFNHIDGIYDILNRSYVRVFFTGGDLFSSSPVGYQVFQKGSNVFKTNKYNFSIPDGSNYTFVAPNISYGFSYINSTPTSGYTWSNFQLNTVFPYYDYYSDNSAVRDIPNWAYTNNFYIFRYDGLDQDSDMFHIGVLSKCNSTFCSGTGLYSNLLYSEYICSFPSFDSSNNSINLSDSCILYGGGLVKNILPFQDSTGIASNNFLKFINGGIYNDYSAGAYNIGLSSNFYISSDNKLCIRAFDYWNYRFSSYSRACYDIEYGAVIPDILNGFDNTNVPRTPEENYLLGIRIFCGANPNSPICIGNPIYQNSGHDISFDVNDSGQVQATVTIYDTEDSDCPELFYTGSDGYLYHQYFDRVCHLTYSIPTVDSSPEEDLTSGLTGLEYNINLAFSGIISSGFKFYSCPFNSPLSVFRLSSIGGLSNFLLDKFFDVNLVGPFNCFLGGLLYSEVDSDSIGIRLLLNVYNGPKYLNNMSEDFKSTISWLLFAGMVLFFWAFRPKDH